MATTLYLIRHGETEAKVKDLVCGSFDSPLTEKGAETLRTIGRSFKGEKIDYAYVSPLIRSKQSLEAFVQGYGVAVPSKEMAELSEISYGEWEGKSAEEYASVKKDYFSKHPGVDGLTIGVGKGVESYVIAAERFSRALKKIAQENVDKTLILLNHSGNIRSLVLTKKIVMPPRTIEQMKTGDIGFGDVIKIESDGVDLIYAEDKK